ncbi:DUF421 domain-containing protein [Sphingomicrobium arenosum]|uniref:DUF421 domain-containing protein n=1 Tax=Sphingomicrobium arenosum TaxID=2233861 RepID=UPI00224056F5|nr:YetF domain-containing protein [Sphingomicrobium arenosum]
MFSDQFWLPEPQRLLEIVVAGVVLYIFTVLFIRLLGKRATAQMNNFDWLIAVATGSLLASGILLRDISLVGALMAMSILGFCQYVMTRFFSRRQEMARKLRATPTLLTHKGHWLDEPMRAERVTRAEVMARIREEGMFGIDEANWVVLEMDGRLSVLPRADVELEDMEALEGVTCDAEHVASLTPKPVPEYARRA